MHEIVLLRLFIDASLCLLGSAIACCKLFYGSQYGPSDAFTHLKEHPIREGGIPEMDGIG